jgi:MFS family permease
VTLLSPEIQPSLNLWKRPENVPTLTAVTTPPAPQDVADPAETPTALAAIPRQRGGRVGGVVRTHLGGLPGTFWIMFGGTLVNRMGGMVAAFLVLFLTARGLSPAAIGLVLAARGIGSLASQPIGGLLADKVGRRFTLLLGLVATSTALVSVGLAGRLPLLIAAAGALGLVSDLYRPASSAMIADVVAPADRAKAFGLQFWAVNLGFSIASVLAGFLVEHGYWLMFAVDAGSGLVFAVIIAVGIRRDPVRRDARAAVTRSLRAASRATGSATGSLAGGAAGGAGGGAARPTAPGYRTALRDRLLVALVLLTLGYASLYQQAQVAVALAIHDAGLSPSVYGTCAAINGIVIVLLQPVLTGWLARFDRMYVLGASWALVGGGMALTGLAHASWQFGLTVVVWTVGEVGTAGFTAALVADLAPAEARGRYQALFGWGWGAAALVGPTAGTWVYGTLGPAVMWLSCLAMGLVCGVVAVVLAGRVNRRRTAALAAALAA